MRIMLTNSPPQMQTLTAPTYTYVGTDKLDVMSFAVNYNKDLAHLAMVSLGTPFGTVLDFGAGTGGMLSLLAQYHPNLVGYDPDPQHVSRIQSRGIPAVSALTQIPNASLSGVCSFNVLEHIEDDVAALTQLRAKMVSGAKLFVYVPAFMDLYTQMDTDVGHYRRYTREQLCEALAKAGFQVEAAGYHDPLGYIATRLLKFMGRATPVTGGSVKFYDRLIYPLSRAITVFTKHRFGKNVWATAVCARADRRQA